MSPSEPRQQPLQQLLQQDRSRASAEAEHSSFVLMGHTAVMGVGKHARLADNEAAVVHDTLALLLLRDVGHGSSHCSCPRCDALAWDEVDDVVVLSHCDSDTASPFPSRISVLVA